MHISSIHCFHYRNIENISFETNTAINCIIGQNGVGKTNILDSIYYLAFCKSNILSNDMQNVKHHENSFLIRGSFHNELQNFNVSCAYSATDKDKVIKCDDKKYTRFSDHIGKIPLIFISPADMFLINGSSSERRKFIDSYISLFNNEYLQNLLHYNKLLLQRNNLLKQSHIDATYLSIIDEQLCSIGTEIFACRKIAIEELQELVQTYYNQIATNDTCAIGYESQLQKNSMHELLSKSFERDKILSYTSSGIHRDDLHFEFNGGLLKNVGSQGQKKTFLLSLKFAQYRGLFDKKKCKPILLLDDLFDKLDKERTENVFSLLAKDEFGQIFITDTNKILLYSFLETQKQIGTIWTLANGEINQQPFS